MRPEVCKLLFDMAEACRLIDEFTDSASFSKYAEDRQLASAVERQLEIVGEAVNQLAKLAPDVAGQISEHRRIVALRNILIHAYGVVDDKVVWDIVQTKLPVLRREVSRLLEEAGGDG